VQEGVKSNHIISLLEDRPLGRLSESELATVKAHVAQCAGCLRAYRASEVSTLLLKEHVAREFEPSHFFATRVLARVREQQAAKEGWAFARLWRATGALVSSMAASVAVLAVLTLVIPSESGTQQAAGSVAGLYSVEEVLAQESFQESELTDAQVFNALYGSPGDSEDSDGIPR